MIHGNAVIILHIFSLFLFFFMLYTFKYTLGVCRYACLIYNQMKKKNKLPNVYLFWREIDEDVLGYARSCFEDWK